MESQEFRNAIKNIIKEIEAEERDIKIEEEICSHENAVRIFGIAALLMLFLLSLKWIYLTSNDLMTFENKVKWWVWFIFFELPIIFTFMTTRLNLHILNLKKERYRKETQLNM